MTTTFLVPKPVFVATIFLLALLLSAAGKPAVHVDPMDSVGPRPVEAQTQSSVIRDYLLAWQAATKALADNQAELLDPHFVGQARQKLADTIRDQQKLGMSTTYEERSHNIRVVFYSPEGLSIQLLDDVEYDQEVRVSSQSLRTQHIRTRFVAVLTPAENMWKVRVFQGGTP